MKNLNFIIEENEVKFLNENENKDSITLNY